MVNIGNLSDISNNYNEIWFIVRRMKPFNPQDYNYQGCIRHVSNLSPSDDLLNWALKMKKECRFSKMSFDNEYRPRFLKEIKENKDAQILLNYLRHTEKNILLVCYCQREEICHRSIVKELINNSDL